MTIKQSNSNADGLPSDPMDPNAPQDAADSAEVSAAAKARIVNNVSSTGTIRVTG